MKLKIENGQLKAVNDFLYKLELKPSVSRARQKVYNKVSNKLNEFSKDFQELNNESQEINEKVVSLNDKRSSYKRLEELNNAKEELIFEFAVINLSEYKHIMKRLYKELVNYDEILSEADATAYDVLLDEFEKFYDPAEPIEVEFIEEVKNVESIEDIKGDEQ